MTENNPLVAKIQAAFDKAKSCQAMGTAEGEAEAEVALMLAERLMTKYNISEAMLREQRKATDDKGAPEEIVIHVPDGPYRRSRALLLNWIVGAMTGAEQRRICHYGTYVRFFGFPEDELSVKQMFEMVEKQMVASGKRRTTKGEHRTEGLHAKTWLVQYFQSYAAKISQRLRDARQEAAEEVVFAEGYENDEGQTVGRVTGALVLATKTQQLDAAYKAKYEVVKADGKPKKRQGSAWKAPKAQAYSENAHMAGREDGKRARINPNSELANRRAIR